MDRRVTRADGADAPYWDALAGGKLLLPRCDGCDRWMWPAGLRCGACGTIGVHWEERPMAATVFSWTRTWHPFALAESFDLPFVTVLAEIDDCGVRLLGRYEGETPAIGDALTGRATTTQVGDDQIPVIVWSRA